MLNVRQEKVTSEKVNWTLFLKGLAILSICQSIDQYKYSVLFKSDRFSDLIPHINHSLTEITFYYLWKSTHQCKYLPRVSQVPIDPNDVFAQFSKCSKMGKKPFWSQLCICFEPMFFPQFHRQLVYKPHLITWILLPGQ